MSVILPSDSRYELIHSLPVKVNIINHNGDKTRREGDKTGEIYRYFVALRKLYSSCQVTVVEEVYKFYLL